MQTEKMTKKRELYLKRDFTKLNEDGARIQVYLKADLKDKFQGYCKDTNISMSSLIATMIHKYLYEALLFESK